VGYGYPRFQRGLFVESAIRGGPAPGGPFPSFDLLTTEGCRVRRADLLGRPFLVVCASHTSPMARSAFPGLRSLHERFGGRVRFLTLYVREAHPGEHVPQPLTHADKATHARALAAAEEVPWPILVDHLDGSLHQALGGDPASVYLVDAEGVVAGRVLWANDTAGVRRGLEALLAGRRPGERRARALPLLRGLGVMGDVLREAGPYAERDLLRAAPPVYALARAARLLRPLPPLARGALVVGLAAGAAGALVAATVRAVGGGQRPR
jgi:hypothetical protein